MRVKSASDYVDDATFWPALPCMLCRSNDVAFFLDAGNEANGACENHLVRILKDFVLEQRREVLVMRNCPVGPLQAVDCGNASPSN